VRSTLSIIAACLFLAACAGGGPSPAPAPGPFSFGVATDCQYADQDASGVRHYRNSPEKLRAAVENFNRRDLAFVIHLGDLIDQRIESVDRVKPIYDGLRAPHHHALGNHDFAVADSEKDGMAALYGMPAPQYDFTHGGWRFIVLNSLDLSTIAHPEGSPAHGAGQAALERLKAAGKPNAQSWNGGIGANQMNWLEEKLSKADASGEKVVLFAHHPILPAGEGHNLWNDEEVVALIDRHPCVAAWINGHNHAGAYAERNGVHYLTVQGMVDTADENAFAVIDVHPDRLEVVGFGRVPSRTMTIRAAAR